MLLKRPFKELAFWLVALVLGIPAGLRLAEGWRTESSHVKQCNAFRGRNRSIFGWDISFFVFTLPATWSLLFPSCFTWWFNFRSSSRSSPHTSTVVLQAVPRPHATCSCASSPRDLGCGCLGDYWGAVLDRPLLAAHSGGAATDGNVRGCQCNASRVLDLSCYFRRCCRLWPFRGTWRLPTIGVVVTALVVVAHTGVD